MSNCIAYNVRHGLKSSTMCVPLSRFDESFIDLYNNIDNINGFTEKYINSDGVQKDDKNIGIIIVNSSKKIVDINFTQNLGVNRKLVEEYSEKFKTKKYNVSIKFPNTLF
ncbi:MAG: TA0956 family protein [Ferroplasma sp.]